MSSEYGDLCREIKEQRADKRAKYGVPCPECVRLLPKANPSILLPGQACKIHHYRDPRKRTYETEYLHPVTPSPREEDSGKEEGK